jgi:ribosomal protein L11
VTTPDLVSLSKIEFKEYKNVVFYHEFRVFIFGTDVTPWVTSKVGIKYADRDGVNICSFSISNVNRVFEYTESNLQGEFRLSDINPETNEAKAYGPEARYSEFAKASIINYKRSSPSNKSFEFGVQTGIAEAQGDGGIVDTFQFHIGSLVFHKMDPVRVFVKNPFSLDDEEWVCGFTGYIDSKPFAQNYVNGESTINLTCQDIRMKMQVMRTQTNPSAQVGNENIYQTAAGTVKDAKPFNDQVRSDQRSHILAGLTYKQTIHFLFHSGVPSQSTDLKDEHSGQSAKKSTKHDEEGIARYYSCPEVAYDASKGDTVQVLEKWQNFVIFGPKGRPFTKQEMREIGSQSRPGALHDPDKNLIRYLFPAEGTPGSNTIEHTIDADVRGRPEFSSRLELLTQVSRAIDYQFYVTGYGEFIFEFPMYDFLPEHFGRWGNFFQFHRHLVSDNISDESGQIATVIRIESNGVLFQPAQNDAQKPNNKAGIATTAVNTVNVFSPVLASRIGVIELPITVPGVTDQGRLATLGKIEFNKQLANYNTFDMQTSYRPCLSVNRPVYHMVKERMGITKSVDQNWEIRGEATTSMDISFVRLRQPDEGAKTLSPFKTIAGAVASPISYRAIYEGKANAVEGGVGSSKKGDGASNEVNNDAASLANK